MSTLTRGMFRPAQKLGILSLLVALGLTTAPAPAQAAPSSPSSTVSTVKVTAKKAVKKAAKKKAKKPYAHGHHAHHGHKHGKYTHYHAAHHVKNRFGHTHGVHHAHKRGMKGHTHLDHHPILKKRLARAAKKRAAAKAQATRTRVIRVARAQKGDPYRYGATGPNAFDCSGLTTYVFKKAAKKRLPRTSRAQRAAAKRISARAARPGDLVFFHNRGGVYHVGIYAGKRKIWHAPYTGSRVRQERIWTKSVSYGRVLR